MEYASLPQQVSKFFLGWIGWGWTLALLLWVAGTVLILTRVQRYFMERTGSRRITIVIFIVWSLAVIAVAARLNGFGAPSQ